MSATTIIDTAPLGVLIRYTDGSPKPPTRFTKKFAAWERSNGVGRLVKKEPPRAYPTWTAPASFTLHEGNVSSDGVIFVTIMRSHSADSRLIFEVAEKPKRGQVIAMRGSKSSVPTTAIGQGARTLPPEPCERVRGLLTGGPLTDHVLVPRCRGAPKDPSPKTEVCYQEHGWEAGGVPSITRTIGS